MNLFPGSKEEKKPVPLPPKEEIRAEGGSGGPPKEEIKAGEVEEISNVGGYRTFGVRKEDKEPNYPSSLSSNLENLIRALEGELNSLRITLTSIQSIKSQL